LGESQPGPYVGAGRIFGQTVEERTKYDGGAEAIATVFDVGGEMDARGRLIF